MAGHVRGAVAREADVRSVPVGTDGGSTPTSSPIESLASHSTNRSATTRPWDFTQCTGFYGTDSDIASPLTLQAHADPADSCHLLEDWRPYFEYLHVFGGSGCAAACPGNVVPAQTAEISCDIPAPAYPFHALAIAQTSSFIAQTCGMVIRACEGWRTDPNAPGPWPCPCDSSKYDCTDSEGQL